MGNFAIIPIIALLSYSFLLLAFIAAKKNRIINAFLVVLGVLILWTGGSFCMRMQIWPSIDFWYDVSILGLTLLPYSLLNFVYEFADIKSVFAKRSWLVIIIAVNVINMVNGFFLAAPKAIQSPNAETVFVYEYSWTVGILFAICALIILNMFLVLLELTKKNIMTKQQFSPIILGIIILFLGHIGIMIPAFKGFPTDILASIINAFFLFYALYKRNLFQLKLVISRGSCYAITAVLSFAVFINLIRPLEKFLTSNFRVATEHTVLIIAFLFTLSSSFIYFVLKHFFDMIFIKDEIMQAESLKEFSLNISKSLNANEILAELADVIQRTIGVKRVFICMADKNNTSYEVVHSTNPLDLKMYSLKIDNPLVSWLDNNNACLLMKDFRRTVAYKSMWENEKRQFIDLNIECIVPLRDDSGMIGIILLSEKEKKSNYSIRDISFLDSINSIGSIAVKNSKLYEKVYLEARTDELTGLLNRKYFYEILQQEYDKKLGSLALIILNIDDFKLYNQLYGNKEGDIALQNIAQIIRASVGDNGYVARYSGKEFGIILPSYDLFSAKNLADGIRKQILNMNKRESDYALKMLTVSGGICSIPYAASNVRQLIDNADMAIYMVKRSGKNAIMVYTGREQKLEGKVIDIIDHRENIYSEYASTIYALTAAIDTKDHYTFNHSRNVAYYATELAYAYGMNEDCVEIVREAALLHDIGKIGIPEQILNKPGKLTNDEYEVIKGHVESSIGIIRHLPSLDYVIPAVIGHHERYDGNGYPRRISKEDIPISARILCIADSFDAMTSTRPYKEPYSISKTLKIMEEEAGLQFDPKLVRIFIDLILRGSIKVCEDESA
ncbi:MAG: diguanylate cyclase and metal dependent phosphohydrolase [Anaerocolumna sp.]|jgi:diguanylate cyclase (GGDEF)-like protein/putative nucleotidyltransferase with HDIG domain|nr:diguanylate cyclase and metal dependent phosphohydrolase [Anaerocolumna sp.]